MTGILWQCWNGAPPRWIAGWKFASCLRCRKAKGEQAEQEAAAFLAVAQNKKCLMLHLEHQAAADWVLILRMSSYIGSSLRPG